MMTMAQGARETRTAATANSVTAAAGAAGDYLTNEEAYKMLRGANSGVKPELGHRLYRVVKRTVDIVAAGGALVLLFIPGVILSVVICIKSPGASPLYSQWRVGRVRKDGTFYLFKIYKFRSMVPNADQMLKDLQAQNEATGPMFKMKHDPRIIPGVGNFIRKHSIDELPQLINVFLGQMNLIGPRSGLPREVALGMGFSANAGAVFSAGFTEAQVSLARELLAIMTLNVASTLFTVVFNSYITAHERFVYQQTRQLVTTLATPLCAWALLAAGMGPVGVALAQLAVNLVLLALNARYAIVVLGMRFELRGADWGVMRGIAAFSAWIFGNQVCEMVNQSVPNIMLGAISGATAVSLFAVAVNIRQVFYSLSTTMSNVFIPKVNRIVATSDDNAELTRLMTRVGRYQMVLFCWVYGGFAILGKFFVTRWAGPGFAEAYWLVLAMTLPVMVPLCQNVGIEIQRAKNMHHARSLVYLAMAVGNVAFTAAAAPALGPWAPAIAYVVSIVLGNGLWMNWYYQKRVGLDMLFFWKRNLPVLLAWAAVTVACLAGTAVLPVNGWPAFLEWGAVYSALFAVALWLAVLTKDERIAVVSRLPFLR